jgi:glutamate formiminotransferase
MPKRIKKTTPRGRYRHNISMAEETRERGEKLAAEEKRSFSNLIEALIDREWRRIHGDKDQHQQAAA